jgi:hypothetical protein
VPDPDDPLGVVPVPDPDDPLGVVPLPVVPLPVVPVPVVPLPLPGCEPPYVDDPVPLVPVPMLPEPEPVVPDPVLPLPVVPDGAPASRALVVVRVPSAGSVVGGEAGYPGVSTVLPGLRVLSPGIPVGLPGTPVVLPGAPEGDPVLPVPPDVPVWARTTGAAPVAAIPSEPPATTIRNNRALTITIHLRVGCAGTSEKRSRASRWATPSRARVRPPRSNRAPVGDTLEV